MIQKNKLILSLISIAIIFITIFFYIDKNNKDSFSNFSELTPSPPTKISNSYLSDIKEEEKIYRTQKRIYPGSDLYECYSPNYKYYYIEILNGKEWKYLTLVIENRGQFLLINKDEKSLAGEYESADLSIKEMGIAPGGLTFKEKINGSYEDQHCYHIGQ